MGRFDVYRAADGVLLLDCQADLLNGLNTRIVVPLMEEKAAPVPARRLNPLLQVGEQSYVMVTQFLAAVPARELVTRIASLEDEVISQALDMLLTGI